jgi:uncharacterized membrane protein
MAHYRSSVSIEAPAATVFTFISDVRNLPQFVGRIESAEPTDGDGVRFRFSDGTVETGTVKLHHGSRVEWSAADFHGWIAVDKEGEACSATMEVHGSTVDRAEVDAALWALKALEDGATGTDDT